MLSLQVIIENLQKQIIQLNHGAIQRREQVIIVKLKENT